MIALAIATGIGPDVWLDMGERAIVTAWELVKQKARAEAGKPTEEPPETPRGRAPQMSG